MICPGFTQPPPTRPRVWVLTVIAPKPAEVAR
jgi:hypothetical protein